MRVSFVGEGVPRVRVIVDVALVPADTVTEAGLNAEVRPTIGRVNRFTEPEKPVRPVTVTVEVAVAPQLTRVNVLGFEDTV